MQLSIVEVAEIIGAIGIIGSLLYAGVGLRRNALAVRANAYADTTGAFADIWMDLARSPELTEMGLRGGDAFDALDRVEKARLRFFVMAYARRFEIAYYQHKLGILTNEDWRGIDGDIHTVFGLPGWVSAWRLISNRSSGEFRNFIEKVISEENAAKP